MPTNPLRSKLSANQTTHGMWITLESPNITEVAVALGMDWVVFEMEHGHLDWRDIINHVRVTGGTQTASIIRVADVTRENIQRALDIGADGLILPMIGSGEQLEQAYAFGRYPPRGVRGVGGERCVLWGLQFKEYLHQANEETMLIPLLETKAAVENIDEILAVDGLEAVFFGPADMSSSYGYLGEWEGGDVASHIQTCREKAAQKKIASGILARNPDEAALRHNQGFRMLALGADMNMMIHSLKLTLDAIGDD